MKHAFCTLRRRRTCVVNPTTKTDASPRQVAKLLGSSSGRKPRERAFAEFMSEEAHARFRDERNGGIPDDFDLADVAKEGKPHGATPEAVKPLDGVSVSLDSEEGEMVIVADGRKDRVPIGKTWSFY